jgi:hypothetical protein
MPITSRVAFYFDRERDLLNIYQACNSEPKWGESIKIPSKLLNVAKGNKFDECKLELEEVREEMYNSELLKIYLKSLNESWGSIEIEFFERMKKITGKDFTEPIKGFITTVGKCPYNPKENSFFICLFDNNFQAMKNIGHEIFHLIFHRYYWDEASQKLGNEKAHDLKEALTVLLNLEFNDLWFSEDEGYPAHKELREFISNQWKKERNWERLLDECVSYLSNERRAK